MRLSDCSQVALFGICLCLSNIATEVDHRNLGKRRPTSCSITNLLLPSEEYLATDPGYTDRHTFTESGSRPAFRLRT